MFLKLHICVCSYVCMYVYMLYIFLILIMSIIPTLYFFYENFKNSSLQKHDKHNNVSKCGVGLELHHCLYPGMS